MTKKITPSTDETTGLTNEEVKRLEQIKTRVQGIPDWAPHKPDGSVLIRVPGRFRRNEEEFVAYAPEDVRWLLNLLDRVVPAK